MIYEKDIRNYTIKVHALKSSSKLVGAMELSELAEALENAGNDNDSKYIDDNTKELLSLYRRFKSLLSPLFESENGSDEDDREYMNDGDYRETIEAIGQFAEAMDYDSVEMMLESFHDYRLKKEDAERVDRIKALLFEMEWADIIALYLDGSGKDYIKALIALKVANAAAGKSFIIIGTDETIQFAGNYIPAESVIGSYTIPLDTTGFLAKTCDYIVKGYDESEFEDYSVLIVDDDASLMSTIREWLKDKYKIHLVNTGMNARKWLQKNTPRLIVLDYEMPLMSGSELYAELKADDRLKNIPVIFMTGKGDKNSVMEVMSLKPEGYLLKPVDKKQLLDTIAEVLIAGKGD